jgi:hypothetical protein
MITPSEIRDKANNIYPKAVSAWLEGRLDTVFPWPVRANLKLSDRQSDNVRDVELLRNSSKAECGFGYSVTWENRSSRKHGVNDFPIAITLDSMPDLLKLVEKQSEFKRVERRVQAIRKQLPELEPWLLSSWKQLIDLESLDDLILVTQYLKQNPKPDCFARELPLAIPTKLVQNYESLLREWWDIVLPPESIDCSGDRRNFEQRYGFRYYRKHILTRILDPELQQELRLFTSELSLPPQAIDRIDARHLNVVIAENKVTWLTLPSTPRGIAFFGEGNGVTQLFDIGWLREAKIVYWGDLDVQGFEILARLRHRFPQTVSILMDMTTIREYEHLATAGTGHTPDTPIELNERESQAFVYVRQNNLRIEQEHILQRHVNSALGLCSAK